MKISDFGMNPQFRIKSYNEEIPSKITLKKGDNVVLWNGSCGEVIEIESPMITLSNPNTYPQSFHKMNIKTVNGIEIDGRDVILPCQ